MNAKEVAKMTMYGGFVKYITENATQFAGNEPMEQNKIQIVDLYATLTSQAKQLATDNTTYSHEKTNTKQAMAETASTLAGIGQIGLRKAGLTTEAAQLHTALSDYLSVADVEAAALAGNTYTLLFSNKAVLVKYISDALLAQFETEIEKFNNTKGSSTQVKQTTPELTKSFKANVRGMDALVDDMVILGKLFKTAKPAFYNNLAANGELPPISVNHTGLSVTVKNKATHQPLANATLSLSTSSKTDISDDQGFAGIDTVRFGNAELILIATGFKPTTLHVSLNKGKDNHFDVELEAV